MAAIKALVSAVIRHERDIIAIRDAAESIAADFPTLTGGLGSPPSAEECECCSDGFAAAFTEQATLEAWDGHRIAAFLALLQQYGPAIMQIIMLFSKTT
jgi:hypothetical protein